MFERIIVSRLERHMADSRIADLADSQYGFRRGRSICDALVAVKKCILEEAFSGNNVVLAVGLDVANAFNSLPWGSISLEVEEEIPPLSLPNCGCVPIRLMDRVCCFRW